MTCLSNKGECWTALFSPKISIQDILMKALSPISACKPCLPQPSSIHYGVAIRGGGGGANLKFSTGGVVWPNYPVFARGLKILVNTRFAHSLYNRLPQLPVPQLVHPIPHKSLICSPMLTIGPSVPNSAPLAPCWRTRNF